MREREYSEELAMRGARFQPSYSMIRTPLSCTNISVFIHLYHAQISHHVHPTTHPVVHNIFNDENAISF